MSEPTVALIRMGSERPESFGGVKRPSFLDQFARILDANAIPYRQVHAADPAFWQVIKGTTHAIARPKGEEPDLSVWRALVAELERRAIRCLPDTETFRTCGDKLALATFFAANKIPAPVTMPLFGEADLECWASTNPDFPVVVKLRKGAGARNVALCGSLGEVRSLVRTMSRGRLRDGDLGRPPTLRARLAVALKRRPAPPQADPCLLVQAFVPRNAGDRRVTVIGERAFCFYRGNRPNDFRASGSGLINYDPVLISAAAVERAFDVSKRFGLQTMAYDFLESTGGEPVLVEMNYTYVGRAVADCPFYLMSDGTRVANEGRYPQLHQLCDLLGCDLAQPSSWEGF